MEKAKIKIKPILDALIENLEEHEFEYEVIGDEVEVVYTSVENLFMLGTLYGSISTMQQMVGNGN